MVLRPDQERVRTLLQDTITLLCRNGLNYKAEFDIKALIGITVDKDEIFLVDIKETIKNATKDDDSGDDQDEDHEVESSKRRKVRRKRSHSAISDGGSATSDSVPNTPVNNRVKAEEDNDSNSDAIIIKDEPGDSDNYGISNNQGDLLGSQSFPTESLAWDTSQSSFSQPSSQLLNNSNASMSSPMQQQQNMDPLFAFNSIHNFDHSTCTMSKPKGSKAKNPDFRCEICGISCKGKSSLRYHRLRHQGLYPYHCPYCGHGSSNNINMKTHLKSQHTGKLGYHCLKCSEEFENVTSLKLHWDEMCGKEQHGGIE